jgi:hypothetical protein
MLRAGDENIRKLLSCYSINLVHAERALADLVISAEECGEGDFVDIIVDLKCLKFQRIKSHQVLKTCCVSYESAEISNELALKILAAAKYRAHSMKSSHHHRAAFE